MRKSLTRNERLRSKREIAGVFKASGRISGQWLAIRFCRNNSGKSRICITLKRKLGNAVLRNRNKRILREVFRLNKERIKDGYDFVFVLLKAGGRFSEIQHEVMTLLERQGLSKTEGKAGI